MIDYQSKENELEKDSMMVYFGFVIIAIINYTKYISSYTILKKTFYLILVRSTIRKIREHVKNVVL